MENRNKSALRDDYNEADKVMEVEAEHTRWWNTVDEYLSDDEVTKSIIKAHQVTLLVLRFESVLALHRSVLATSKKNSAYNAALQRCISASRSIINTLHKAIKGFGAFDGSPGQRGYESTPLLWPSFTWAVWMSVFIVVFAATEGQVATPLYAFRIGAFRFSNTLHSEVRIGLKPVSLLSRTSRHVFEMDRHGVLQLHLG
jgi:hypothetical protein